MGTLLSPTQDGVLGMLRSGWQTTVPSGAPLSREDWVVQTCLLLALNREGVRDTRTIL